MNWTVIILESVILTIAFTAMILIPLVKNPVWWIHDYPKDIQEEYFKTLKRIPQVPDSFIAWFYCGLGPGLLSAGIRFILRWWKAIHE